MTTLRRIAAAGGFAGLLWAAHVSNVLSDNRPIDCTEVAGTVTGSPGVKSATSAIVPPSGTNRGYCRVNILYGTSADQNINMVVRLPLNSLDGGAGGVEGAWNGRTQGVGGGGCSGNILAGRLGSVINARLCRIGHRRRPCGRQLRARRKPGRHVQRAVHPGLEPQRHQGADPFLQSRRHNLLRHGARSITTGTAARPAAVRATCSRRNSATSSTASWPTRRRSTGRVPDGADVGPDRHEGSDRRCSSPRPSRISRPAKQPRPATHLMASPTASLTTRVLVPTAPQTTRARSASPMAVPPRCELSDAGASRKRWTRSGMVRAIRAATRSGSLEPGSGTTVC